MLDKGVIPCSELEIGLNGEHSIVPQASGVVIGEMPGLPNGRQGGPCFSHCVLELCQPLQRIQDDSRGS